MMTLLTALALAQPPAPPAALAVKGDLKQALGKSLLVEFTGPGKTVRVVPLSPGLEVVEGRLLADPRTCRLFALKAGTYKLLAYSAEGGEPTPPLFFEAVFGDGGPVVPPAPGPDVPAPPADPFAAKLQRLYDAEPAADKAKWKSFLAGAWAQAAEIVRRDEVTTAGQVLDAVRAAVQPRLGEDKFFELRRAVADEVNAGLSSFASDRDDVLDARGRQAAAALFARISKALDAVK